MSTRLHQYRLLWQAAHAQVHPRFLPLLWSGVAVLGVALAALLGWHYGAATAAGWALCLAAGVLLCDWTLVFIPGALRLNWPANAQLVPGMRARLIELACLSWLAWIAVLLAGLALLPEAPRWALLYAMAMTLGMATGLAGVAAGMFLLLPVFGQFIGLDAAPPLLREALMQPAAPALLAAAWASAGLLTLRLLLLQGGDKHWAMVERQLGLSGVLGRSMFDQAAGRYGLQRWLIPRVRAGRDPGALMLRALGYNLTLLTLCCLLGAALSFAGLLWLASEGIIQDTVPINIAAVAFLLPGFLFLCASAPVWMGRTQGEQALVRLAPALPAARGRFNRMLATALLRQGLTVWAIVAVAMLAAALASGVRGMPLLWHVLACCMTLPALCLLLRDHARHASASAFLRLLLAAALSSTGPVVGALGKYLLALPFWPTATAAALLLAAMLVHYRWRLMCNAPVAFPAGRLD